MRRDFPRALLALALIIALSASPRAEDPDDFAYATDHLQEVLEFERTGIEIRWRNPKTGKGGSVLVDRTYFPDIKTPCRDFILTFDVAGAAPTRTLGTGCRGAEGDWQLTERAASSSGSTTKRNWPSREFAADGGPIDGSSHDEPTSERRLRDGTTKEQRSNAQFHSAAREASTDLGSHAPPDCAGESGGEPSIEIEELDLVILLDTTSSMRRELGDIQADFTPAIEALQRRVPSLNVGFVAYRDRSDTYLTRAFQLAPMTGRNLRRLGMFIERLEAEGGGDVPEAIHEALSVAKGMAWRPTAQGRIVVISDAPAHRGALQRTFNMVRRFHSDAPAGEFQRRVSAIYTGSSRRRNTISFYQHLVGTGGGCFSSHQGPLIENALLSVL